MNFDKKIAEIRKNNNLTQEDLAEKLNVSRQTVSNWETNKCYPDIETLVIISNKFNISLDVLIKEDKKMVKDIDKKIKVNKKLKHSIILLLIFLIIGGITIYVKNNKIDNVLAKNNELKEEIKKIKEIKNGTLVYTFDVNTVDIKNITLNSDNINIYIDDKLVAGNIKVINYKDVDGNTTNSFASLKFILIEVPDNIYQLLKKAEYNNEKIVLKNSN